MAAAAYDACRTLHIFQETSANNVLENGLVEGHAYTVTGVKQVRTAFI